MFVYFSGSAFQLSFFSVFPLAWRCISRWHRRYRYRQNQKPFSSSLIYKFCGSLQYAVPWQKYRVSELWSSIDKAFFHFYESGTALLYGYMRVDSKTTPEMLEGTMEFPDGSVYAGYLYDGQMHGHGKFQSQQATYDGCFENGLFNGNGTLYTADFRYTGEFCRGVFHGIGTMQLKRQIYPQLQLLKDNEVEVVSGSFDEAALTGECAVRTRFFRFTGACLHDVYTVGSIRLYPPLSNNLEMSRNFLDCAIDFSYKPWSLSYETSGIRFAGFVDEYFFKTGICDYETTDISFKGIYDHGEKIRGKYVYKTVQQRAYIDMELLNYRFLPISEAMGMLCQFSDVAEPGVLPPFVFDIVLDSGEIITGFDGALRAGEPHDGTFVFENGVIFKGKRLTKNEFSGVFKFYGCEYRGTMRQGHLDGKCAIQITHPLYGLLNINCMYRNGKLQGDYELRSDELSVSASFEDGKLTSECHAQLKRLNVKCSMGYSDGVMNMLRMEFENLIYEQRGHYEQIASGYSYLVVVRDDNGYVYCLKNVYNGALIAVGNYYTEKYEFAGEVRNFKPQGKGIYKSKDLTVNGCFNGSFFYGRCRFEYSFPFDYFREGLLVRTMTLSLDEQGVAAGHGIIQYEDSVFTGYFEGGAKKRGIWQFPTVRFEGQFDCNAFRRGVICFGDYTIEGEFQPGKELVFPNVPFSLHSVGRTITYLKERYIVREGSMVRIEEYDILYFGEVNDELYYHGHGVLTTEEFKYEGRFSAGKFDGLGIYVSYKDNQVFDGSFTNGAFTGAFVVKLLDDSEYKYEGELLDGAKQGVGSLRTEKFEYNGYFIADEFDGQGQIVYVEDGTVYRGGFAAGFKHGEGELENYEIWYKGRFQYDSFEGEGRLVYFNRKVDYMMIDGKSCAYVDTGTFKENNIIAGKRETTKYWEEGTFQSNVLMHGKYHGDFEHSALSKHAYLLACFGLHNLMIEGDFYLCALDFRRTENGDALFGQISRLEDNAFGVLVTSNKQEYRFKVTPDYLIDEMAMSSIKIGDSSFYRGSLNYNLEMGNFGELQKDGFYFKGRFQDRLPFQGDLKTREFQFTGKLSKQSQPLHGILKLHHLTYSIEGCFDGSLQPLGICTVTFASGCQFVGMWRHEIFYSFGEIDGNPVSYDIQSVPDLVTQAWRYQNQLDVGYISYPNASYRGKIVDGYPNGDGVLTTGLDTFEGAFTAGRKNGVFTTNYLVEFPRVNEILSNFADMLYFKRADSQYMRGKGSFKDDSQIGTWSFSSETYKYWIDFGSMDFHLKIADFEIQSQAGQLTIKNIDFEYVGSAEYVGTTKYKSLTFQGTVLRSCFQGEGTLLGTDFSYRGGFFNRYFDGVGRLENAEFVYGGYFAKGVIQGKGVMKIKSNCDVLKGQFHEGKFVGGEIAYGRGGRFVGVIK